MLKQDEMCWCTNPLHYPSRPDRERIQRVVDRFGAFINVRVEGGRTFKVQRHYIALHGIRGKDLEALGFEAVHEA